MYIKYSPIVIQLVYNIISWHKFWSLRGFFDFVIKKEKKSKKEKRLSSTVGKTRQPEMCRITYLLIASTSGTKWVVSIHCEIVSKKKSVSVLRRRAFSILFLVITYISYSLLYLYLQLSFFCACVHITPSYSNIGLENGVKAKTFCSGCALYIL